MEATQLSWAPPWLLPTQPKNQYLYDNLCNTDFVTKEAFFPSLLSSPLAGDHWDAADPAPGGSAGAGAGSPAAQRQSGEPAEAGPCSSLPAPHPFPSTARPSHSPGQDGETLALLPELGVGRGGPTIK